MPREQTSSGQSSDLRGSQFVQALWDIGRNWIERVSNEAERGSKLSKDLIAVHSVPEAVAACREWMTKEMDARAEDARQFMSDGQKAHGHQCSTADEWLDEHRQIVFCRPSPIAPKKTQATSKLLVRVHLPQSTGGKREHYLRGRKITTEQDYRSPPVETLYLIGKLRSIGMEEEAEQMQMQQSAPTGGVITAVRETD